MKKTLLLSVLALSLALVGCEKKTPVTPPETGEATLTSFSFLAEKNAKTITKDVIGVIDNENKISLSVPYGTAVTALVASFETKEKETVVKIGDAVQESGVTANDFTNPVVYHVTLGETKKKDYTVTVSVLPEEEPEKQ